MQTAHERSRALAPRTPDARQLGTIHSVTGEGAIARRGEQRCLVAGGIMRLERRQRADSGLRGVGGVGRRRRRARVLDVGIPSMRRAKFASGGRHLVLTNTCRGRKEERRERVIKDRQIGCAAAQNRPERVANGAFVRQIDDLERARRVVQFAGPDAKPTLAAQGVAERDQVLRQAREKFNTSSNT